MTAEPTPLPPAPRPQHVTPAQRAAIGAPDVSVCVSAGAGSGKTFVLVERYLELVRRGADPREILTITFTEKAAREMRERIAQALTAPGLENARAALEGGWISTIHGFCARLLRTYSVEADVDPAFGVLTDLPRARVRRAAFAEAQARFRSERPEAFHAIVDRVRWGRDEDGFAGIDQRVFALHEALRAAGARPRVAPSGVARVDEVDSVAVASALAGVRRALAAWQLALSAHPRPTAAARDKLASVSARTGVLDDLGTGPFSPDAHRAVGSLGKLVRGNGLFKDERDALAAELGRLAGAYVEGPARAIGVALDDLVARFDAAYRTRKARLAVLDFGDLEERARDLLEQRVDAREDVSRRFAAILVDEFQDTSRLQQRIVDLVRRPDAFFAVGDVKQAIYGFRHAEVRGLLEVEAEVRQRGGLVIPLDRSFRTRPSVLTYVDAVFAPLFGAPGSEVPHQPLRADESVAFAEKAAPSVEIVLAHGDSLEHARGAEARALAARLASIVEDRRLRGTNPLRKDSFDRPLRYKDCAILFRAMTELPLYERALRERGVPYRVDRGGGFFEAPEVVDALALLRVIVSSRDDLALTTVLRSPLVGLSDDALLALTEAAPSETALPPAPDAGGDARARHEGWLAKVLVRIAGEVEGLAPTRLTTTTRERIRTFVRILSDVRALRGRVRPRDLLARALERTGLAEASLLRSGTARGVANLKKLLEIVDELEEDATLGLEDVAFALEDLRASAAREAEASLAGGDEDAVLLLTVHAAKGLEWPLVAVADLGRADNPWSDPVAWSAETGSVPVLADPGDPQGRFEPPAYARLVRTKKEREREESKRLLYVAMTRARDHLVLAGARGGSREAGPWLAWSLQPLDLGAAPLATEPDEAMGAVARTLPGPDPTGVRLVQVGLRAPTERERLAHDVADSDGLDLTATGDLDRSPGVAGPPPRVEHRAVESGPGELGRPTLGGPLGPEAGARRLLDHPARERILQGLPPSFASSRSETGSPGGGLSPDELAAARGALVRARRPLPEPDLEASSYVVTEVLAYEACPRHYLYEHVLGARSPAHVEDEPARIDDEGGGDAGPGAAPANVDAELAALPRNVLGTIAHRAFELGPERTAARVRELVSEEAGRRLPPAASGAAARVVLDWVARFERSPLGRRAARALEVRREEPFLVRVPLGLEPPSGGAAPAVAPAVLLRGTADLLFVEEGGAVLVDYKTNDVTPLEVPARARAYALQLQLYALALRSFAARPLREAWLSFVAADQAVSVDVSDAALEQARDRLARFAAARRRGEFGATPGLPCRSCAFRAVCPAAEPRRPRAPAPAPAALTAPRASP